MEWYLLALKRYAEFNGRSRRKEYWIYTLYNIVIYMVLYLAGFVTLLRSSIYMVFFGLAFVYALAVLVPSLSVCVRRLHDIDKSGWFILIGLIPAVGGIILLVLLCLDGTPGDNRYGPSPKAIVQGPATAIS
ncbi:MAG TPA: DUF805 domain-containing protein [Terracidiphilus sp.]|nr:DUF805 domain-containing protein [Terracidiphilus sp.]